VSASECEMVVMGVGGPNGEDDAFACERMAMQVAGCEGAEGCLGELMESSGG